MSPNPLFFIFILVMLTLSLVRASPATPAKASPASTSSDIILQLDPGFSEPFLKANVSESDPPDCYTQTRAPGLPRFYPIDRKDCVELVFQMVIRRQSTVAIEWDPNKMSFPIRFRLGTCNVALYAESARTPDVFSVLAIGRVAGLIVSQCATREKAYLGGRLEIGARNAFWVSVAGRQLAR